MSEMNSKQMRGATASPAPQKEDMVSRDRLARCNSNGSSASASSLKQLPVELVPSQSPLMAPPPQQQQQQRSESESETKSVDSSSSTGAGQRRVGKKSSRRRKNQCYYEKCTSTALKFVGDCNFCDGHFCSKHRLLENHSCEGLKSCKDQMHKRNADKLASEQTKSSQIQI